MAERDTSAFVYFMECPSLGVLKIGMATDPRKRLKRVQTGCPGRLHLRTVIRVDDARAFEAYLHQRHQKDRIHGEWFRATPELRELATSWFEVDSSAALNCAISMEPREADGAPLASIALRPRETMKAFMQRLVEEGARVGGEIV